MLIFEEIFVKKDIYKCVAMLDMLITYHYKVFVLLLEASEYIQVQMA